MSKNKELVTDIAAYTAIALMFIAALAAMFIGLTALAAVTIYFGWQWFMVPLGLPSINIFHAYGLGVLLNFSSTNREAATEKSAEHLIAMGIATPLVALLFMWLASLLM